MRKNMSRISYKENKEQKAGDEEIRKALHGIVKHMEASDSLKMRIDRCISEESAKEDVKMKHFNMKKVIIGAAAACLLVGTVSVAGSGLKSYIIGSPAFPQYTKYEDVEKAEAEVGYEAKVISDFSNGFQFKGIIIANSSVMNEAGETEESKKEMNIEYEKNGEKVALYTHKLFQDEIAHMAEIEARTYDKTLQIGEIEVGFNQITNKFVPPDYELTEEDKANMENPNYNFAYGSKEVEINQGFSTYWIEGGIVYNLYGVDLSISGDEMLQMAKEIIENGK